MMRLINLKKLTLILGLSVSLSGLQAADFKLPDNTELQQLSPQATHFYNAGIAAVNKIDYINAYNNLSKAAILEPQAVRLNHITAALSVFRGRQSDSAYARDYYETALVCYQNILQNPIVDPDFRRQITNEFKLAQQEKDNLAQRDVIREAAGTSFYIDMKRQYGAKPETDSTKKASSSAPAATPTPASFRPSFPYPGAYFATPTPVPVDPNLQYQGGDMMMNPDGSMGMPPSENVPV